MNGAVQLESGSATGNDLGKVEFEKRRWILISNIPDGGDLKDLKENFLKGFDVVDLRIDKNTAHFLLGTSDQAINAINTLNGQNFHGYVVGVSIPPPDSFLFVGNLPFEFTEEQFRNLMSPFGPIERIFLVRSLFTGESKGYGFVDYINRESASLAKQQLMSPGSKYVGGRILRVNFAEPNLLTYDDLHSKTLFVDRLPRDFTNGEVLRELFSQSGTVTFAQVAVNQAGVSRGFAFVDYATAEEAEKGQKAHNGALLEGTNVRVAYGTPGRTGASILGGHHNTSVGGQSQFGSRPRGPSPHVPQGADAMGARGPRPLMAPRPLMGSEPWQQMPRGHPGRPPRPLMRPGHPGARFMASRSRGASPGPGGARGAVFGHGPRPLLGRSQGPRVSMRHAGPRGFAGMGVGGPPSVRPMGPRGGNMQPRPLMDFGEQLDGTAFYPEQMQAGLVGVDPAQQPMNETIPNLMGEPMAGGGFAPVADPGMFGQTAIQPMSQQQEVLAPAPVQQQGMLVPSQPQGPRTAVPQLMQAQTVPGAPVASYPGTLPGAQTQVAAMPQVPQQPVMLPTQQMPNGQMMYATSATMPTQAVVPQVVPPDPAPLMGIPAPGSAVAGQTDLSAAQHGVTGIQQIAHVDPAVNTVASSGYVVLPADANQQTAFYAPQDPQSQTLPQYTSTGQVPGQQPAVQLPVGTVQPGAVMQSQVPPSQPTPVPMVTPQTPQYQWYQQVPSAVGSVAVTTPITQNTPMQVTSLMGTQWPQAEQQLPAQPLMTVPTSGVYGQFQQTQQYPPQQAPGRPQGRHGNVGPPGLSGGWGSQMCRDGQCTIERLAGFSRTRSLKVLGISNQR